MQREYETTFIINSNLEDGQVEAIITRYQEFVTKNGGEVTTVDRWGRRRLAYTIRKKNAGFYVQVLHKSPTDIVSKLERTFKLDEDVIRHLTVVVDKNMLKARAGMKRRRRQRVSRTEQAEPSNQSDETRPSGGRSYAVAGKDRDEK
ncbi:MAG TPA: 30S ribosomal protein S6 [Candidatus Kryptobacter bacterium]|nr:30S ribosomal protein S6 [Candidatus Kryptobacter bacterium]